MSNTVELAQQLIRCESVTPVDAGCQQIIADRLTPLGFTHTHLRYGDVDNLWSVTSGTGPLFVFAGHTDVVPTGPVDSWTYPPFSAEIHDGNLYGRGAADMKSSIAAMIVAVERILKNNSLDARIGFLITGDEEGPAVNGTVKVIDYLQNNDIKIDWCVVGEPTSTDQLGDFIKNGRRGSLNGDLLVKGTQGHVAYPHLGDNPVHRFADALGALTKEQWDNGNEFFPATTFQISNIHAGTGVTNVIPGELSVKFNFRFSTELTVDTIKQRVEAILDNCGLRYELNWNLSGNPFITGRGELVNATIDAIKEGTSIDTELSTSGGTSDGRFIAPTGAQVIELGPCNATIHQIDEHVSVKELDSLTNVYEQLLTKLFHK